MSPLTDEHVVPEAAGGGLILRRVCKDCNDRAGRIVDCLLVDNALIAIIRYGLRLPNRDGRIPNPFAEGVLHEDPSVPARWHPEAGGPGGTLSIPFRATETKTDRGTRRVTLFPVDQAALDAVLDKMAHRRGLTPESIKEVERTFKSPKVTTTSFALATSILPALFKIAFELGHHWLGNAYLSDPGADALRVPLLRLMQSNDGVMAIPANTIEARVAYFPTDSQFARWASRTSVHLAALSTVEERVFCALPLFNVIEASVLLSETRSRYAGIKGDEALVFEPTTKVVRACTHADLDELLSGPENFKIEWTCDGHKATVTILDGGREAATVDLAIPGDIRQ